MKRSPQRCSGVSGVLCIVLSLVLCGCGDDDSHQTNDNRNNSNATCPTVSAGADITAALTDADPALGGNPTASGGTPPYTYSWTGDATFLSSTSVANPTFDLDAAGGGEHTVCVAVTDGSTCAAVSDCVTIAIQCPTATITATPSGTHCTGEEVVLDAGAHSTYLWSTGATTRTITVTADDTYSVQVTDGVGCTADAEYLLGSTALPVALDAMEIGVTGGRPRLIPSPAGDLIYLFYASPDAEVKTFDVTSESWLPGALVAPGTGNTIVRWIGQDYAVDPAGNLHVVWGEGTSDCVTDVPAYVRHVVFDGTAWGASVIVAERSPGDPACGFQNVAMASDGAGRVLVTYQVPTMVDTNPEHAVHPKMYRIYDGSTWSAETTVGGTWKSSGLSAGGGGGSFYVGYMVSGGAVDTEISLIPPGSTSIDETTKFSTTEIDLPVNFLVEASGTTHVVWQTGDPACSPQCHASGLYYNYREAGAWMEGNPGTRLACESFFGDGSLNQEEDAPAHVAISTSGRKLVVFTYMSSLYYLVQTDGVWGPIYQAEIGVNARWSYPIALGSTERFLIVWSTHPYQATGTLHYAILQL